MNAFKLHLTAMANGGMALGRDKKKRVVFVPFGIPGELVEVTLVDENRRYAHARLEKVLEPSPDRITPRCAHFYEAVCSHFQHIDYPAQLEIKRRVVQDQLKRIGGLEAKVRPVIPSPAVWAYQHEVALSPTPEGELGLWSAVQQAVIPIRDCQLMTPPLQALVSDFEMEPSSSQRVVLRQGADEALLVALEAEDLQPPGLLVDFPVSVAVVLPDRTTVNLIGENYVTQRIGGREFQVSAGCFFYQNPAAADLMLEQVMACAALNGTQRVLELYSGVGVITAALAGQAAELVGIDATADAVEDAAANLEHTENVALYHGFAEEVLPALDISPDVVVAHPPDEGLSVEVVEELVRQRPARIVYVSGDVATLARDGKRLAKAGYRLGEVRPIDMHPHLYYAQTVSVWRK